MSIGPAEIVIVLVIALLVFGPQRLPQMGHSLGRAVREFRKAADTARSELGLDDAMNGASSVNDDIASMFRLDESKARVDDVEPNGAGDGTGPGSVAVESPDAARNDPAREPETVTAPDREPPASSAAA